MMCWIVTGEITVLKGASHLSSSHLCFPYRPARKLFGSNSVSVLSSQKYGASTQVHELVFTEVA